MTTFFLDHDIDTGRIILQKKFNIPDEADVEYVYDGLMRLGAEVAIETIDLIISHNGLVTSTSQEEFLTKEFQVSSSKYQLKLAPKLFKETYAKTLKALSPIAITAPRELCTDGQFVYVSAYTGEVSKVDTLSLKVVKASWPALPTL